MKKLLLVTIALVTAGLVVEAVVNPATFLHRVFPVFLVWLGAGIVNWLGVGAMLATCALTRRQVADQTRSSISDAVRVGMENRWFWIGFWYSMVGLVVNTFAPLGLIGAVPAWTVVGVMALNVVGNIGAVPFRLWLWRLHKEPMPVTDVLQVSPEVAKSIRAAHPGRYEHKRQSL